MSGPGVETVVVARPSPRLAQLHEAYTAAKVEADAAKARLDTLTAALKAELSAAAPESDKVTLPATASAPALQLSRVESWRIDTARLKRENLATYVAYAKKSQSWVLRAVSAGEPS